jgi:hypothetical protein
MLLALSRVGSIPERYGNAYTPLVPFELTPEIAMQLQGMTLNPLGEQDEPSPQPDEQAVMSAQGYAAQKAQQNDNADEELINALINGMGKEM